MTKALLPIEAAKALRTSYGVLAQWRHLGRGPRYVKIGSKILYTTEAIEEFLRDRERRATSDAVTTAARNRRESRHLLSLRRKKA